MKLKIKVKVLTEGCMPTISDNGDWIDLKAAQDMEIRAAQAGVQYQEGNEKYRDVHIPVTYIPLGIAVKLPNGFEALINSRSSGPNKLKVFIPSGQGVIDNSYSGNGDQWHYVSAPMSNTNIKKGVKSMLILKLAYNEELTFGHDLQKLRESLKKREILI